MSKAGERRAGASAQHGQSPGCMEQSSPGNREPLRSVEGHSQGQVAGKSPAAGADKVQRAQGQTWAVTVEAVDTAGQWELGRGCRRGRNGPDFTTASVWEDRKSRAPWRQKGRPGETSFTSRES